MDKLSIFFLKNPKLENRFLGKMRHFQRKISSDSDSREKIALDGSREICEQLGPQDLAIFDHPQEMCHFTLKYCKILPFLDGF